MAAIPPIEKTNMTGRNKCDVLAIIAPCYNEEALLAETTRRLSALLDRLIAGRKVSAGSYIMYVNDGSCDNTWAMIEDLHATNKYVCGVNLAGNVGQQNALIAGMTVAKADADMIVTIDADLQDDVDAMEEMVDRCHDGCDIVYGVRSSRKKDTWFKRSTAQAFYRIMESMGVKDVNNHSNYRLMSRRAVEQFCRYRERNLFLPGMVPLIGYKTANVYYERGERLAGESKYPLGKLVNLAVDGITSFSVKPVRMVLSLGVAFIVIDIAILVYVIASLVCGKAQPGWSSLMLSVWFCAGCVLIGIGVVGEYIGKIYIEVKDRPRYNIERILPHNDKAHSE